MKPDIPPAPTPEEIARCAFLIWEQEGFPEGRALEHWLEAETQLLAAQQHERLMKPAKTRPRRADTRG